MASCWWLGLFTVILKFIFASSTAFDHILDDVQSCKDVCDKTYPLHTYPKAEHSECCKRGCRFFSLVEFINKKQDVNESRDACMASCMEAYSQTGDRYACNIGCTNQMPFALQKQKEETTEPQSMHLLMPLMFVHNIYNNMMDRMSRIMSVSWSFYIQQDDGKVVVLQSEPELLTEYLDMDEVEYDKAQDDTIDDMLKPHDHDACLQLEKNSAELRVIPLPDVYHYHQSQESSMAKTNRKDYPKSLLPSDDLSSSADWLGCVARKSGLPRWLIGLTILFSAIAMVWLCFTSSANTPDRYLKPQKLSIYGDIDYLEKYDTQTKVSVQPTREEAPPLPVKIEIAKV